MHPVHGLPEGMPYNGHLLPTIEQMPALIAGGAMWADHVTVMRRRVPPAAIGGLGSILPSLPFPHCLLPALKEFASA